MRVGKALCLFSMAHSLELVQLQVVLIQYEGSLKGELLARSLVQSKWKSMLFKGKPNGKILCASHG